MANQRTLFWNEEHLALNVLGEKPYKLMRLKQSGFPIPDFFTVVSNGSGELNIDDSVKMAYEILQKPLIARSAHPMEGNGFSFSGRFQSIERVARLTDSPGDEVNYVHPMDRRTDFPDGTDIYALDDEWFETRTFSLERAYREIVDFANPKGNTLPSHKVKEYLEDNKIQGFDYKMMNLLVMEQRKVDVFGMFLTSDQARQNEIVIHFQDRRNNKGDWVVYEKGSNRLKTKVEGDLEGILTGFGNLAARVEMHFGKVQQVEIGYSDHGVEVYQARDINLGNMASVPRFGHYKTFSTELHAEGAGYFHLPILVIDALDHIHSKYFSTREEELAEAVNPYREQIKRFIEKNPDYIVVVKDGKLFTGHYSEDPFLVTKSKKQRYAELNEITGKAKVVFRGKNQIAIRHDDWDFVESGGISIWMSEVEKLGNFFLHNEIVGEFAEWKARDYSSGCGDGNYVPPNVTLLSLRKPIRTGDYLHVLANTDGTFVWTD